MRGPRETGQGDGHGRGGPDGPRRPLRLCGVLREVPCRGDQAHPGLRGLRGRGGASQPGGKGSQRPPAPPRGERRGVSEPGEAGLHRQHRRVLLQAPNRPRPAGPLCPGPDRLLGLPGRGDPLQDHRRRRGGSGGEGGVLSGPDGPRELFPGGHVERHPRAGPGQPEDRGDLPSDRHPSDRHQRRPLSSSVRRGLARGPALRPDELHPQRPEPLSLRERRLLPPLAGGDERLLRGGAAGGADEHPAHRGSLRDFHGLRPISAARVSPPRGRNPGLLPGTDGPGGIEEPPGGGDPRGIPRAAGVRAGRDPADGVSGLLLHRRRHHRRREGAGDPHRSRKGLRRGVPDGLVPGHHRAGSDPLQAALRAFPEPRADQHARYRHGRLGQTAGRGVGLHRGEVRRRPGLPDRRHRPDEEPGRRPGRGPGPGDGLFGGRRDSQADPGSPQIGVPVHSRGHREGARASGADGVGPQGPQVPGDLRLDRGTGAAQLPARGGGGHRPLPPDGYRPGPPDRGEPDRQPVLHGAHREARAGQDGFPGPADPLGPGGRPGQRGGLRQGPRGAGENPHGRSGGFRDDPAGGHPGDLSARVLRDTGHAPPDEAGLFRGPDRGAGALPSGAPGQRNGGTVHRAQARPGPRGIPPPLAGGGPEGDLRGHPLPGTGHAVRRRAGGLFPGRGGSASSGHGEEKGGGDGEAAVQVRRGGRRQGRGPEDRGGGLRHHRGLRGVRVQQVPQRGLRPDLLLDRLAEGPPRRRLLRGLPLQPHRKPHGRSGPLHPRRPGDRVPGSPAGPERLGGGLHGGPRTPGGRDPLRPFRRGKGGGGGDRVDPFRP